MTTPFLKVKNKNPARCVVAWLDAVILILYAPQELERVNTRLDLLLSFIAEVEE